jgi:hypothetical protein
LGAKFKKMERAGLPTRDVLLLFCMFALRKDGRKLQYSRSNILGFINKEYFRTELKMQPTIHFRTVSNLKCHIIYFSRGFLNNQ